MPCALLGGVDHVLTTLPRIRLELLLHTYIEHTVYTEVSTNKLQKVIILSLTTSVVIKNKQTNKNPE